MIKYSHKHLYVIRSASLQNLSCERFHQKHLFKIGISEHSIENLLNRFNVGFRGTDLQGNSAPLAGLSDWELVARQPALAGLQYEGQSEQWLLNLLIARYSKPRVQATARDLMLEKQMECWPRRTYLRTNGLEELRVVAPLELPQVEQEARTAGFSDVADLVLQWHLWINSNM